MKVYGNVISEVNNMENIMGINEVRIKLSSLLKELAKKREPLIITSKSKPRAVLMDYENYKNLMRFKEEQARFTLTEAIRKAREKAKAAGLTPEDVKKEIRAIRGK